MSHIFYDVYVDWPAAQTQLKAILENEEHVHEMEEMLDKITHHEVFSTIFSSLPNQVHAEFIEAVYKAPHAPEHILFIQRYDPDIEQKLRAAASDAHQRFFDAIHAPMID